MISTHSSVRRACVAALAICSINVSACAAYDEPNWNEVRQEFVTAGNNIGYEDPQSVDGNEYQVHMSHNGCALYLTLENGEHKIATVENTHTKEGFQLNYPLTEDDIAAMKRIGC